MTTDWWWGVITGGLAMTAVWGAALLVGLTARRVTRQLPMAAGRYTGDEAEQ